MAMGFLPDNYDAPATGNYMRFQIGDNRFRALGAAIVGSVFWVTDSDGGRRPVRRRMDEIIDADELGVDKDGKQEHAKHFWSFPVWNCTAKQVQILEITQRTVQDGITTLIDSGDWGDPTKYDIIVNRFGSGLDTKYATNPAPPAPLPDEAAQAFADMNIDMDALFSGDDPFAATTPTNDTPPAAAMTRAQATKACKDVGISEEDMLAHLQASGLTAWGDGVKGMPLVLDLVAEHTQTPAHAPLDEDEIPF